MKRLATLIVLVVLVCTCACAADPDDLDQSADCTLSGIRIVPAYASIPAGATQPYELVGTCADGTSVLPPVGPEGQRAVWTSTNPSVATVDQQGVALGVEPGSTTVEAELGTLSASAVLTVVPGTQLQAIAVQPSSATLAVDVSLAFTAAGRYSDGSTADLTDAVTWRVDDAAVASISDEGVATGRKGGSTAVVASLDDFVAAASLRVLDAPPQSLDVLPETAVTTVGDTVSFTATATFEDGETVDVTTSALWSSSDETVAAVDDSGVAVGVAPGEATLTALWEGLSAESSLLVESSSSALVVEPSSAVTEPGGAAVPFVAKVVHGGGSVEDVTQSATWTSSLDHVAHVSASGVAEPLACSGITIITAAYDGMTDSATLQVGDGVALVALDLQPASMDIPVGTGSPIVAAGTHSDGSVQDLSGSVTWESSDPAVADVDTAYTPTVMAFAQGSTEIRARMCSVTSNAAAVTVIEPAVAGIQVEPVGSLPVGCATQLRAIVVYSDGSTGDGTHLATWTSSAEDIVAVLNDPAPGVAITKSPPIDSVIVTASVQTPWGVVSDTEEIYLFGGGYRKGLPPPGAWPTSLLRTLLVTVQVEPPIAWRPVGAQVQFGAYGEFNNGEWVEYTQFASWSASDVAVAATLPAGLVTPLAPGQTSIQAQVLGVIGSATLNVDPDTVTGVRVVCDAPVVQSGLRLPCRARAKWPDSVAFDVTAVADWSSSDPAVVSVSGGVPTAVAPGVAIVAASHEGHGDAVEVEVVDAQLASIEVSPAFAAIPLTQRQQYRAVGFYTQGPPRDLTGAVSWLTNLDHEKNRVWGYEPGRFQVRATFGGVTSEDSQLDVLPVIHTGVEVIPLQTRAYPYLGPTLVSMATHEDDTLAPVSPRSRWGSADGNVVSVARLHPGPGHLTGLSSGAADVWVDFCRSHVKSTVDVADATLESLVIVPASGVMHAGATQRFRAFGTFSDGSAGLEVTDRVAWDTTTDSVAVVDDAGLVRARAGGTTQVVATFGPTGVQAAADLEVRGGDTLDRLHVWFVGPGYTGAANAPVTAPAYLPLGGSVQARATAVFVDGTGTERFQDVTEVVRWSSTIPARASVSNAPGMRGLVNAALDASVVGTATIDATLTSSTGTVSSTTQATVIVTACDTYTSYDICSLSTADACVVLPAGQELPLHAGEPVRLGVFAAFAPTAPACQGLGQQGYWATRHATWSPTDGRVAIVDNAMRPGEVAALGSAGDQTEVRARWQGWSDAVAVRIAP